jgi:alpha-glucosidase (family GH31 glycosyl hydrolase)
MAWLAALPSALYAQATLHSGPITLTVTTKTYSFTSGSRVVVGASRGPAILLAGSTVTLTGQCEASPCVLDGATPAGRHLKLTIHLDPHHAELLAQPEHLGDEIRFITGGASPAFGLADHAVQQASFRQSNPRFDTELSGFSDDTFLSGQGGARLVSNFVIYPRQGFAELLIDPTQKIVHTSATEIVQGVVASTANVRLHYFFGTPHEIYFEYLKARRAAGYPVFQPKYEAFGVGWEAFGALAWDTDEKTVRSSVDRYIQEDYPLTWIVIGSGFWPAPPEFHETTSFGLWDHVKYPTPKALLTHFHEEHLKTMLGLRITFITSGPFASDGVSRGFFLKDDGGRPKIFPVNGWPKMPYYLLDAQNPAALDWYSSLTNKWKSFGVDGYKEDFYGFTDPTLRDDKVDPTNDRLMREGALVIERNGYLSSNGDLHRINDFNHNQDQDRGPVNALAFAYSGFPFVYPDIVGGTFGESHFSTARSPKLEIYMQRNAQWAALHSSMGMGEPPWTFSPTTASIMLKAANLHNRIAPYLFAMSRRTTADGYPWTMTPLPIAFPEDPQVYGHENATDRGYEWMIGDAMLAVPLYGNDYDSATTRDIYLPGPAATQWMDFDTGTIFAAHQTLKAFPLPPGKTPLFIGGSGVTLEQFSNPQRVEIPDIRVVIYPIATGPTTAALSLPGSDAAVTIKLTGQPPRTQWTGIIVKDSKQNPIPVTKVGHSFTFTPVPGERYSVTAER